MARRRRIGGVAALAALLTVFVFAAPAWAETKTVNLTADNTYSPAAVTINEGDTVQFVWQGGFHDVVFADGASSGSPTGDVGTTYSRTFTAAGSYAYICTVHEALGMKGTVTVQAAQTGSTTTTTAGSGGATTTTVAGSLPFTGPEDTLLPIFGVALLLAGAGALGMARRRRTG